MSTDTVCGPNACPITTFSDLTPAEQRVQRARKAKDMAERGFTHEQIAKQFGVSRVTITTDLLTLSESDNVKGQGKDTLGRKKSTGRPRGRKGRKPSLETGVQQAQRAINTTPEEWDRFKQQALAEGYESAAAKLGDLVAEPEVARADLSLTAQHKFDLAVAQEKRRLAATFNERVRLEVHRRVDEFVLPDWKQQVKDAQSIYEKRRGLMDKTTFNTIRRALHPDSRQAISDSKLSEAFDAFMKLEKHLLNEKDSPTDWPPLPETLAEWDKMRAKRTARRAGANLVRTR